MCKFWICIVPKLQRIIGTVIVKNQQKEKDRRTDRRLGRAKRSVIELLNIKKKITYLV